MPFKNDTHLITWLTLLLLVLFGSLIRVLFLNRYGSDLTLLQPELQQCFKLGLRFDLKAAAFILLVPYLAGCILSYFGQSQKLTRYLLLCFSTLSIIILLINYYYYAAFGNNFDESLFGFQGEPYAVGVTIWQDYPVIKVFICAVLSLLVLDKFLQYLCTRLKFPPQSALASIFFTLTSFALYFIALRGGSVGTFPLMRSDADFSSQQVINSASYNGVLALADTLTKKLKYYPKPTLADGAKDEGIYHPNQTKDFSPQSLFTRTPSNPFLRAHPPNVVFIQMESMGRHLLLFDNEKSNDLLASLRPYAQQDFLFTHFISDSNSTSSTLARLTFNSPMDDLFSTKLYCKDYATFVTRPFKAAGYETIFLTPGQLGWFNSGKVLHKQGFDRTIGKFDILRKYPNVVSSEAWGLYEQYAYDYALDLLLQAKAHSRPVFIYINTVTNHPPYSTPPDYKPKPLQVPQAFAASMNIPEDRFYAMLAAYQYANHALGDFIHKLEEGELKDSTIVAATGDHNHHELMPKYNAARDLGLRYGVVLYLHIPPLYLRDVHIDTNTLASHKDIFPTLYNLSLSHAVYPDFGRNLAAFARPGELVFGNNKHLVLLPDGIISLIGKPLFYPWEDEDKIYVGKGLPLSSEQEMTLQRIQAYNKLLEWQVYYQYASA